MAMRTAVLKTALSFDIFAHISYHLCWPSLNVSVKNPLKATRLSSGRESFIRGWKGSLEKQSIRHERPVVNIRKNNDQW